MVNDEDLFHVIGKRGAIRIIRALYNKGKLKYSEIELLMNKNPKMTSNRLEELIKLKILERDVVPDRYRTVDYSLTEKGLKLVKLIEQVLQIYQNKE